MAVAMTVILAAVLYILIAGLSHGPSSVSLGSEFHPGSVLAGSAPGTNSGTGTCAASSTTAALAIAPGEWVYTWSIESSAVTFGSVGFEVFSSGGAVLGGGAGGGFYILNSGNTVVACGLVSAAAGFAVMSGFTYTTAGGLSPSSPLTSLYTIVIDTGSSAAVNPWSGQGNYFLTVGLGSYSGSVGGPSSTELP
jgi:hypothetical protein